MLSAVAFGLVQAQQQCLPVDTLVSAATDACADVATGELCVASGQPDLTGLDLAAGSHTGAINEFQSFSSMASDYGVTVLDVPMTAVDGSTQAVAVILLGSVSIENLGGTPLPVTLELTVTAANDINVRSGPGTSFNVITRLNPGASVTAQGRNAAGDWVQVTLEDGTVGWVSTRVASLNHDVFNLAVVPPNTVSPTSAPMQAFRFTGPTTRACPDLPPSGILIQTPAGAGVELQVNGGPVTAWPNTTLFLQFVETKFDGKSEVFLAVNLLHFADTPEADGVRVLVRVDDNFDYLEPPVRSVEPYDMEEVGGLQPFVDLLPVPVTISEPIMNEPSQQPG